MLKAKTHKMERAGDGQFGTVWSYKCDMHPIEETLKDGYFDQCVGNVIPGDSIQVIEIKNDIVSATYKLMVVKKTEKTVSCRPMEKDIVRYIVADRKTEARRPVHVDDPGPQYIKGSGEVKWNPGRKKHVVTVDGKVIGEFQNKEEAQSVARGDVPLPA